MQTKIRGIRTGGSGEEVDIKASRDGDLRVVQYLPPYTMLCAAGVVFGFDTSAGTAKAPVTAVPTSTATWSLYNDNPGGGKHIVLLKVGIISESGTLGLGMALLATVAIGAQTAEVGNYTGAIVSCMDGTAKTPSIFIANATTLVGTQSAWIALAARPQTNTIDVGSGLVADVDGMIIAPPGGTIGFDVLSPAGTSPLYDITIIVAEIQLDT